MKRIVTHGKDWERRGGNRGYASPADRQRAVTELVKRGFDHFIFYKDTQSDFALSYGVKVWGKGSVYIDR